MKLKLIALLMAGLAATASHAQQTNSDYNADGTLKADAPKKQLYNLRTDPRQSTNVIREYP